MTGPHPNLFVIGAAKSGTTSLHRHLARHPDVFMSDPKEPGYFAEGLDYYPSDREWYLGLFRDAGSARYRGESSTHYTKLPLYPSVAQRIASFCDDPRFIYVMRDPVDRAISHYWHRTRKESEFREPLEAMKSDLRYRAFGDYPRQLSPYLERFPGEWIYTMSFERLVSDPAGVTADIFRWLELDPSLAPEDFPAENATPESLNRSVLGQGLGQFVYQSDTWDSISPHVPQLLKDTVKRLTTQRSRPSDRSMDEVVDFLRPWALEVAERTAELLGREFSEWTTTMRISSHDDSRASDKGSRRGRDV